jgi:hypothetical protein
VLLAKVGTEEYNPPTAASATTYAVAVHTPGTTTTHIVVAGLAILPLAAIRKRVHAVRQSSLA